ncbi:response regulator transcription factor [Paenibacillus antri]|uniref:Response regulator transcription factor n=1 Tax=Paenibacillus antri TaxID=2582848 RepID=A0A5R9GJ18_9BACL|nr:response regulator transcription factor [Paenibacillus antri]TLS51565.1 response regulator transcription factor [Paenibacillus antri]
MNPYRVLIVDDHPLARSAVRSILESSSRYVVVGEAGNGMDAYERCGTLRPDLVLMDINMPGWNGLETTRRMKQTYPLVKVVILSVSDDVADLFAAIQFGAQGYLMKNMEPDHWIEYLDSLFEGKDDVSRGMAGKMLRRFRGGAEEERDDDVRLTDREKEILTYIAGGGTNKQIADRLSITENTVKTHIKHLLEKLRLQNRVQLASYAFTKGMQGK